VGRETGSR